MASNVNRATGLCPCGEPPISAAELEVVRQRLAEGATYRAIGRELDRDHSGLRRHARRMGLRSVHRQFGAAP
jgi:hypothetical protein